MKFSCPKCAAKYQIADEKVQGRTVKMKCRKCGTTIPIRAPGAKKTPIASAPTVRADSLRPAHAAPRRAGAAALKQSPAPAAVAPAPAVAPAADPAAAFDWHAGIEGKSVGPMSLREVERRIGDGEINEETYVWRDGMDEWKPIPEVPELEPVLRRSLRPMGVAPPSMPAPAKEQRPVAVVPAPAPAPSPIPPEPVASDPVIKQAPAPDGWAAAMEGLGDESDGAPAAAAPAAAAPAPAATTAQAPMQEAPVPTIALPSDSDQEPHHRPSYETLVMQLQKKRQNPMVVPFAVVAAIVLGVTIGFVLFGDQETKIVKQIVEVPAKVGEAMNEKHNASIVAETSKAPPASEREKVAAAPARTTGKKTPSTNTGSTGTKTAEAKPSEVKGLQGLQGLDGLGGPSSGPAGPSAKTGGGQPLSSGQIQSTVSKYSNSVKRGCWERALMARDKTAPSSARVTVAITVSPSGSVTGASSGGDPRGYPGLSSCITRRVRGWKFPPSSGKTTVNVPFVFAAQ